MMPPSPLLSARMMNPAYFTETTSTSAQNTSESTPSTLADVSSAPCSPNACFIVYSGLVPISPYTTPIAPSMSLRRCVALSFPSVSRVMPVLGSAQRRLQRLADDVLGAVARRGRLAHEARDFRRLVAECLQRGRRFVRRIARRAAA